MLRTKFTDRYIIGPKRKKKCKIYINFTWGSSSMTAASFPVAWEIVGEIFGDKLLYLENSSLEERPMSIEIPENPLDHW